MLKSVSVIRYALALTLVILPGIFTPGASADVAAARLRFKEARLVESASHLQIFAATDARLSQGDQALYTLGNIRMAHGDYAAALGLFEKLYRQHPGSVWARAGLEKAAALYRSDHRWPDYTQSLARYLSSILPELSYNFDSPRAVEVLAEIKQSLALSGHVIGDASLPAYFLEHHPEPALAYASRVRIAQRHWKEKNLDAAADQFQMALEFNRIPGKVLYARLGILDATAAPEITRAQLLTGLARVDSPVRLERLFLNRTDVSDTDISTYYCERRDIVVDGVPLEWNGVPVLDLDRDMHIFRGERTDFEDFSAYFSAAWSPRFLYLLVRVLDERHEQGNGPDKLENGDSIEIACSNFIDTMGRVDLNTADNEYFYAMHKDGRTFGPEWSPPAGLDNFQFRAIRRMAGECVYELALPWEKITETALIQPGFRLRFNVTVNDSDSRDRDCTIKWTPRSEDYRPLGFGAVELR